MTTKPKRKYRVRGRQAVPGSTMTTTQKNEAQGVLANLQNRHVDLGKRLWTAIERGDVREEDLCIRLIKQTLTEIRQFKLIRDADKGRHDGG